MNYCWFFFLSFLYNTDNLYVCWNWYAINFSINSSFVKWWHTGVTIVFKYWEISLLGLVLSIYLTQRIVIIYSITRTSAFGNLEYDIPSSCSKSGISSSSSSCITFKKNLCPYSYCISRSVHIPIISICKMVLYHIVIAQFLWIYWWI